MKKINTKKLNQFYLNGANSPEMRSLVENAVNNFVFEESKNPVCIAVLNDLGLLSEE